MKQIYMNPEIKIVKVHTAKMIAASKEMEINSSASALENESSIASRRSGSIWDDDDTDY